MISDLDTYELINRYLKGLLSEEEKALFEKQQNGNPAFAEEVKLQSFLNDLVLEKGLADIHKKVGEDLSDRQGSPWFKPTLLLTAALCIVAGGIVYTSYKEEVLSKAPYKTETHTQKQAAVSDVKEIQSEEKRSKQTERLVEKDQAVTSFKEARTSVEAKPQEESGIIDTPVPADRIEEKNIEIIKPVSEKEPCGTIIFDVKYDPSCYHKQTGKIQILISNITGGSKPYSYSIAGSDFGLESVNNTLGAGTYLVQVQDTKGCISEKIIPITEKDCIEFEDYSFNPLVENWKFPFNELENGIITITDKSGQIVYSSKIVHANPDSWSGRSLNSEMLGAGSYLYVIESNGLRIKQGYITILY